LFPDADPFQADADFNQIIVSAVARRYPEIDLRTATVAGLAGLKDAEVLALAGRDTRVLITHDHSTMPRHFRGVHSGDAESGKRRRPTESPGSRCGRNSRTHLGGNAARGVDQPDRLPPNLKQTSCWRAGQILRPPVQIRMLTANRFPTFVIGLFSAVCRDSAIGQEAHRSRANRVKVVVGKGSSVSESLSDVGFFEIRQFSDDLRRRHAIRDQVDDVRDGNAQTADRGPPCEHIRVLRDAVECDCHDWPLTPF
jgi:hypothetical protein